MSEQKINPNIDCFGTIDKKNKEKCHHCSNSNLCESFKPKLEQQIATAKQEGITDYINKRNTEVGQTKSKYIVYGFVVIVVSFLFLVLYQDV